MPSIPVLRRQRWVGLCGFEDNMVYIRQYQDSQCYTGRPCLKTQKQKPNKRVVRDKRTDVRNSL